MRETHAEARILRALTLCPPGATCPRPLRRPLCPQQRHHQLPHHQHPSLQVITGLVVVFVVV